MRRSSRLFEIIQILRAADKPVTASRMAETLEVSERTIYRDVQALQAMRTPIEGEAGIGYVIRRSYNLPPLNFDAEEIEALYVGLAMLTRTGDSALTNAADRICAKIEALNDTTDRIHVAPWGAPKDDPELGCVPMKLFRDAVRDECKLELTYRDGDGIETVRIVRPLVMVYHLECVMLAAWCELRGGFRHFRVDRVRTCTALDEGFEGMGNALRKLWIEAHGYGFG